MAIQTRPDQAGEPLSKRFTATLVKRPGKGGWTYVVMPDSIEFFGSAGS